MEYVVMALILFAVLYLGFKIGWFLAKDSQEETKTEVKKNLEDLYCFECEIEMPVTEKNGRLWCSNCGLRH